MGEARRRGTYEQRKAVAMKRYSYIMMAKDRKYKRVIALARALQEEKEWMEELEKGPEEFEPMRVKDFPPVRHNAVIRMSARRAYLAAAILAAGYF
jgi:hypothetical protein